ncbi:MAG: U32 family peptidase [Opitutaceae bacterium]|nr:U32 family peptidase [Opitutaceae bacterium]
MPGRAPLRRPEILAPAGDWDCVRAAVENGADAVYFGLDRFNARMRAHNFTAADLPELMRFLHRRGVRGYVTFNTLVFANELADAADYIRTLVTAGVDAAIVQDVGICRMIRALSPDFPIHISTQMTVTSSAGVQFAHELGAQLVVLARENSIKEITKIRETLGDSPAQLPLEVFVHGALCVAYSGQCLTSESLGGRSANRGECAQACRMPYDLVADGQPVDLGGRRYLLSPQDLSGMDVLPDLARLGIASLKIEGRLKSAEYVANLTRVYRQALDRVMAELGHSDVFATVGASLAPHPSDVGASLATPLGTDSPRDEPMARAPQAAPLRPGHEPHNHNSGERAVVAELWHAHRYSLEMAFSRGLYPGWFRGLNNQELVHARYGTKRGMPLGTVVRIERDGIVVQLVDFTRPTSAGGPGCPQPGQTALKSTRPAGRPQSPTLPTIPPVKPGDGLVFDFGAPEDGEEGGRVYTVATRGADVLLTFGHGDLNFSRIHVGDRVWKTNDPALDRTLRASFAGDKPRVLRPITAEVHGQPGTPLTLLLRDELGHVARAESSIPLTSAENQPLTPERLQEQFGRLGGTPFQLEKLDSQLAPGLILPLSELNRIRRDAVAQLDELRAAPLRWQLVPDGARTAWPQRDEAAIAAAATAAPQLIAVIRHLRQLDAVLPLADIRTVYCEFENPKHYREAVARFHADRTARGEAGTDRTIWVAPPRIFKPGDEWILKQVRSCEADGYLVRNFDHLRFFADCPRRGDFSLNVANEWSADYFRRQFGLERVTASYDLNIQQLEALLTADDPTALEITIHQHMPMFHMEHCVFCAFLTKGTDYTNCGRPCDSVNLRLRDHIGAEHPVKADAGCRNTVFNSRAQTGAEFVGRMIELGARHFRVEFLDEESDEITRVLGRYRQLITGAISGAELWREFKLINQLGVTRGQMDSPVRKLTPKR